MHSRRRSRERIYRQGCGTVNHAVRPPHRTRYAVELDAELCLQPLFGGIHKLNQRADVAVAERE